MKTLKSSLNSHFTLMFMQLNNIKLLVLFIVTLLASSQFYSQNINEIDKETIIRTYGYEAKASNKVAFDDTLITNSYLSEYRSSVCSPEISVTITDDSSFGISRSNLNDSGAPSFCTSLAIPAPDKGDIYNTTITPDVDVNFTNGSLTSAQIRERVQRTVSLISHSDYSPSSLPTSLYNSFYKAIQYTVWHWTDGLDITNVSHSWTGQNGNTYDVIDIQQWVLNGTLQPADVF